MNEPVIPISPSRAEAGSCCGPAPAPAAEVTPARPSPCCGTSEGATAAGACCDPQAKREAVATGTGCC